jgi:hypothetical protein
MTAAHLLQLLQHHGHHYGLLRHLFRFISTHHIILLP